MSRYNRCIVTGARAWKAGGLCRDTLCCIVTEKRNWPLGGLCHDTVDCIMTSGQSGCGCVTIQLIVS